jgi:hypothetical protein
MLLKKDKKPKLAQILSRKSMLIALKYRDLSNFAVCIDNFDDAKSPYYPGDGGGNGAVTGFVAWAGTIAWFRLDSCGGLRCQSRGRHIGRASYH